MRPGTLLLAKEAGPDNVGVLGDAVREAKNIHFYRTAAAEVCGAAERASSLCRPHDPRTHEGSTQRQAVLQPLLHCDGHRLRRRLCNPEFVLPGRHDAAKLTACHQTIHSLGSVLERPSRSQNAELIKVRCRPG